MPMQTETGMQISFGRVAARGRDTGERRDVAVAIGIAIARKCVCQCVGVSARTNAYTGTASEPWRGTGRIL